MAEILIAIFQVIGEALLQVLLDLFWFLGKEACAAGKQRLEKQQQEKKRQEYRAAQPKYCLLRAAQSPTESVRQSEELLRPASGINATDKAELLRADRSS